MTAINKYLKQFEAHQNGDMSSKEVEAFIQALEHDSEMLAAWTEYIKMMDAFSDKEAVSLRGKLEDVFHQIQDTTVRPISQNLLFRISAAAVVIVVMGALLYLFCSNNQSLLSIPNEGMIVKADSNKVMARETPDNIQTDTTIIINEETAEKMVSEAQIASIYEREQYQVSPIFAELLHSVYRSGWFKINTPEDSVLFSPGDSLIFSWETNIEEAMFFDILDRNGLVVYKHSEPISSPWVYKPNLSPAIYMFRFARKDEPVWMGVIVGE